MKGTDVTDAQLAHAQEFLRSAAGGKSDPEVMESQKYVTVDKEDIIRLLAWYGAIRAKGGRETPAPLVHRTGPGSTMGFGTPEQLAEMPTPQPVGKIMLAAKDLSPEALDSGATAELCARDLAYERLFHCGTFLPPTRATTLRQAHTDIMNLLANLDVLLEADSDGMSLEDDDRAIVEDIRRRWMEAMKTKEKA